MAKTSVILNRLNDLHQQPEIEGDNRPRISLAHIDVQGDLRRHCEKVAKRQVAGRKAQAEAASAFIVGQTVKHIRGLCAPSTIVAIDGGHITLANGKTYTAMVLVAA